MFGEAPLGAYASVAGSQQVHVVEAPASAGA